MSWTVELKEPVQSFLDGLEPDDRNWLLGKIKLLGEQGPGLGRPHADRIHSSRHHNMKELRAHRGSSEYRIFFAFDAVRRGILLLGGDKMAHPGGPEDFYLQLIPEADRLLDEHNAAMKEAQTKVTRKKKPVKRKKGK